MNIQNYNLSSNTNTFLKTPYKKSMPLYNLFEVPTISSTSLQPLQQLNFFKTPTAILRTLLTLLRLIQPPQQKEQRLKENINGPLQHHLPPKISTRSKYNLFYVKSPSHFLKIINSSSFCCFLQGSSDSISPYW